MVIPGADSVQFTGRVPVIHLEGRLPVLDTPLVQSLGLRDGQVVRPTVEVRDGQVMLLLNGQAIPVPPQLRLAAGERPWWQVSVDARGRATLSPLASPPSDPNGQGAEALSSGAGAPGGTASRLEQLALRPPSSAALQALLQPGALQALLQSAAGTELGAQLARAVGAWPQMGALTGEGLRRLVRQSAGGPEGALVRGEAAGDDLKSLLRGLLEAVPPTPVAVQSSAHSSAHAAATPSLLREAIDDLESRQLRAALERVDGREAMFSMLLPFADSEPVEVRWSHAREVAPDGRRAPWVVELHTDSNRFGKVWMRTRISEGVDVDLVMWAEQAELAARARTGSSSLASWLGQAGLRMTGLQVIHGSRPALEADAPLGPGLGAGRLVDLQA